MTERLSTQPQENKNARIKELTRGIQTLRKEFVRTESPYKANGIVIQDPVTPAGTPDLPFGLTILRYGEWGDRYNNPLGTQTMHAALKELAVATSPQLQAQYQQTVQAVSDLDEAVEKQLISISDHTVSFKLIEKEFDRAVKNYVRLNKISLLEALNERMQNVITSLQHHPYINMNDM